MDNFTFYSPTLYEFGRGAEEKTGMLTFLMGVNKVMIVFGKKYVKANGLLDRIETSLSTIGIEYVEFGGIEANPTDDKVYEAINLARNKHVDGLLAIGGGSVIDTAKAEGRDEGRAEGLAEANISHAQSMKALGVSNEVISTVTGLSLEEIEGLPSSPATP